MFLVDLLQIPQPSQKESLHILNEFLLHLLRFPLDFLMTLESSLWLGYEFPNDPFSFYFGFRWNPWSILERLTLTC